MKIRHIALLFIYTIMVAVSVGVAFTAVREMQTRTRGVGDLAGRATETQFGVNASLEQYSDDQLTTALALIRNGHFISIRQHFYWNDIEPRAGEFQWDKWDRLVARAGENDLQIVAVIDTTPAWARNPGEADLVNAPPANVDDYARFVAAFAARYRKQIRYIEIWDNPNVHPFWGRRNADPIEYTALLKAAAIAARAANPDTQIVAAGLAPNGELIREHPDYSDVLFLRGMYEAGARDYFDIAVAKPYGMWSGPDDRRVAYDVFNFSRAILLRDEMLAHGDAAKPIWAVGFGWNALPQDWRGAPSPWGTDTESVQSARLAGAVQRARSEWPWMTALIAQTFQPNAPNDDPLWGFALVDKNFQPRMFYSTLTRAMTIPVQPASFDFPRFYAALVVLALVTLVAAWRGAVAAARVPWAEGWRTIETRFAARPEAAQFALLALSALVFYYSRHVVLNFALLVLLVFLFALRLDLGLALTVFTIPFYLLPKNLLGSLQFSMVEILTLAAAVAWTIQQARRSRTARPLGSRQQAVVSGKQEATNRQQSVFRNSQHLPRTQDQRSPVGVQVFAIRNLRLGTCDLAVIFFVLVGLLSVKGAANFGVANREFRVIVLEPALLYGLIRVSNLTRRELWRLVDAFILSALVVSLIGLYQYLFTNYVIIGEGVRRILAVYGSPNNLALYLDRALPLVMALALFVGDKKRRIAYTLAALPIALCWYLTWSRGAWLGVAAGLLFIGTMSGKSVRIAIAALLVVAAVVLIPFLQTERAQSLFQTGTGTGFFRISVWESATAMIRDHPIFGVGLDNFLYEYPKYMKPEAWREPNLSHPHNIVLDFWARMGILGVGTLAWMVFEFYRAGLKKLAGSGRALVLGLMASMTAALAHGMMDAAYFYVDLAFVFMLTLGVLVELGD